MNIQPVYFGFGLHNHQPVGNFDFIFEEAYQKAYLPFIEVFEKHPGLSVTQHFTGILIDWFEKHHPEFIDRLGKLVDEGRIEMMGGGYYEPILSMLPENDSIGQIEALSEKIHRRFGARPRGAWIAERVWEPGLASRLANAGIQYVTLDDAHFRMAGLREEQLTGPFLTEDQGKTLAIFPISQQLRYCIPFHPVEETIDYLRDAPAGKGPRCVIMADDGEKFGIWPQTYHSVYEEGWLEDFFTELENNACWLKMVSFDKILEHCQVQGLAYLPTASYSEMMDWVLPWQEGRDMEDFRQLLPVELKTKYSRFIKGGFWRSYLSKYREIQQIHRKMLGVSRAVHALPDADPTKAEALRYLWAAQCNCGYWHGIFGGIYLNHIRAENYHNLILAEKIARAHHFGRKPVYDMDRSDFFLEGGECLQITTPTSHLLFDLSQGAMLVEWDHLSKAWNLINTLSRQPETYHRKLLNLSHKAADSSQSASIHELTQVKEEGLEKFLVYDGYRRGGNILHFFEPDLPLSDFLKEPFRSSATIPEKVKVQIGEKLHGFIQRQETTSERKSSAVKENGGGCILSFVSNESFTHGGITVQAQVEQVWRFEEESDLWSISYTLKNTGANRWHGYFGVEFGWSLNAGDTFDRAYLIDGQQPVDPNLGSIGESPDVLECRLYEGWWKICIQMNFEKPARLWRFPIETVSSSEAGFERTYQSSVVIPSWRIDLPCGDTARFNLFLKISDLPEESRS